MTHGTQKRGELFASLLLIIGIMNDFDELWPGGPKFKDGGAFPLGMDAVLLADFAAKRAKAGAKLCDLGCGSGAAALLLLERTPGLTCVGVEIDPVAAEAARANFKANGWEDRAEILTGDLREHKRLLPTGAFALVVSNPPYFPAGSGKTARGAKAAARSETDCTLAEICAAAAWCLKNGGSLALVHRPERLADVLQELRGAGIEPKRLRFVQQTAGSAPSLALIEGRRGGNPGLSVERPLILKAPNGCDSEEFLSIYHM